MRFFQTAVFIFSLSGAACAMVSQDGHHEAGGLEARNLEIDLEARKLESDLEARDLEAALEARDLEAAADLQALYEDHLERREPKRKIRKPKRPNRDPGCKPKNAICSSDRVCCSGSCDRQIDLCD